ncbi:MAG: hypothetical protein ABH878_05685 [bacterium]
MPDWKAFNQWERNQQRRKLKSLTVQESFQQFCDLYEFSGMLAQAGDNYDHLVEVSTNPHLWDLIEFQRLLRKIPTP